MLVESLTYSYEGQKQPRDFSPYQNMLIAAGNLETVSPTKNYLNFIFLYDYDSCTTYDFQTFEGEEIKSIVSSPESNQIYLIGYNNPNESIRKEQITIFVHNGNERLNNNTEPPAMTKIYFLQQSDQSSLAEMIHNGFGNIDSFDNFAMFLLAPHEMRIYPYGVYESMFTNQISEEEEYIAAFVNTEFVILQSFDQSNIILELIEKQQIFDIPRNSIRKLKYERSHDKSKSNKLFAIQDWEEIQIINVEGTEGKTIIDFIKIPSSDLQSQDYSQDFVVTWEFTSIKSWEFQNQWSCLSADQDSIATNQLAFLFLDQIEKRLFILELDLIEMKANIMKISETLPWFSDPQAVYSPKWDYWLYGCQKTIILKETTFEFPNSVGFIMSANQNRLTELLTTPESLSMNMNYEVIQMQPITNSEQGLQRLLRVRAPLLTETRTILPDLNNPVNEVYQKSTLKSNQKDIFIEQEGLTQQDSRFLGELNNVEKNEWIQSISACKKQDDQDIDSICFYFQVFDRYNSTIDVDSQVKSAPKAANFCNRGDGLSFSFNLGFKPGEKNMRATCFPKFKEENQPKFQPRDSRGNGIVQVNTEQMVINLTKTLAREMEVLNKKYILSLEETSEDVKTFGYIKKGEFLTQLVRNQVFNLTPGKDWLLELVPVLQRSNHQLQIVCWSIKCPAFIHTDIEFFSFSISADETDKINLEGTYVYYLELTKFVNQIPTLQRMTYTFVMPAIQLAKQTAAASTVFKGLNITGNFDDWYRVNKQYISFWAPPPKTKVVAGEDNKTELLKTGILGTKLLKTLEEILDEKTINILSQWTDQMITEAYAEARERLKRPTIQNNLKVKLDERGNLTISFENPVNYPKYILDSFYESKPSSQRRERRLNGKIRAMNENNVQANIPYYLYNFFETFKSDLPLQLQQKRFSRNSYNPMAKVKSSGQNCSEKLPESWCEECMREFRFVWCEDPTCIEWFSYLTEQSCQDILNPPSDFRLLQNQETAELNGLDSEISKIDPVDENGCKLDDFLCQAAFRGCLLNDLECLKVAKCNSDEKTDFDDCLSNVASKDEQYQAVCLAGQQGCNKSIQVTQQQQIQSQEVVKIIETVKLSTVCNEFQFQDEASMSCKPLKIYFGSLKDILKITVKKKEQEEISTLLVETSYDIQQLTDKLINVKLVFKDPTEISPEDKVLINLDFSQFDKSLKNFESIEQSCPRQVLEGKVTNSIQAISTASKAATASAAAGSIIAKILMRGSLAQVWGMINGMQFIIHVPALNVGIPAQTFIVIKQIVQVATFDIPYVSLESLPKLYKVDQDFQILTGAPEDLVKQLDQLGYNSPFISTTMGSSFLILILTIIGLLLILITFPCKKINCCVRFNRWLKQKLLWNWVIRLLLEQTLELGFSLFLLLRYTHIRHLGKEYFGSLIDYAIGTLLVALIVTLPIFILVFYCKYFDLLGEDSFKDKYGTVYEGLDINKRSIIAYQVVFIFRRLLFCAACLFMFEYVIIQISLMVWLTIGSVCFLFVFHPNEDRFLQRLDLMNELITVILIDICFLFTNILSDSKTQYNIGYLFVVIMLLCIAVHVFFLLHDLISLLKLRYKRYKVKRQNNEQIQRLNTYINRSTSLIPRMFALFMTKSTNIKNSEEESQQSVSVSESDKKIEENAIHEQESSQKDQEEKSGSLSDIEEDKSEDKMEPDLESGRQAVHDDGLPQLNMRNQYFLEPPSTQRRPKSEEISQRDKLTQQENDVLVKQHLDNIPDLIS